MIGTVDVEIQAANPQMPLRPMRAFVNSPSSVRVRNVPTKIGSWNITSVRVVVAYPDSSIKSADCVLADGAWVATVAGCAVSGTTENGFAVFASGVDENGDAVSNYALGKGLVEILKADGTLAPDAPAYYVHLLDEAPDAPNEGDVWPTADGFVIWQNGEAHALGVSITVDPSLSPTSENPVQNKAVAAALYTGFTEWVLTTDNLPSGCSFSGAVWSSSASAWIFNILDGSTELGVNVGGTADSVSITFVYDGTTNVATRHLITPTKTSQLTNDSGFITQHQQLTPVYSQTPTFSEWTFADVSDGITDIQQPVFSSPPDMEPTWSVGFGYDGETRFATLFSSDGDATNLAFAYEDEGLNLHLTATRARTDIIGYTLGDQTTKPLQPKGDYLTEHQSLAGLAREYTFSAVQTISSAGSEQSPNEVTPVDAQNKRVSVEAANAHIAVALPAASANGHIRDFMLTLDCSSLTESQEPTVTWGTAFHPRTDAGTDFACAAGVRNVYYISEYAQGEFVVGGWQETAGGNA